MHDILLIRGTSLERSVDLLWVAAELAEAFGDDAQIDIATPVAYADYLRVSQAVRRVVGVAPPDTSTLADMSLKKEAGGWGNTLFSAAKKLTSAAGQNARAYWAVAEELRLVRYSTVFEFDSSSFGAAISRVIKADKIVGFDERNIDSPIPGAKLLYHEIYHIGGKMSDSMRVRELAAKHFNYSTKQRDLKIPAKPAPTTAPPPPYVVIGGNIPAAFLQILTDNNITVVGNESGAPIGEKDFPPDDLIGLTQNATAVFGNGIATAFAALVGTKTLFIGNERDLPEAAIYISTPAALLEAIQTLSPALPAEATTEEIDTPPSDEERPRPTLKLPGH